eukprot:TRINITY_DN3674_c0_g1_i1.p1 TRINITY_DN3674_c0_g1~~TRINITY_DN3674_c0_g1_i1.p1  ORF type:complete len:632 (-),score=259.69 TRINITY_DN3674_c0_g1_i1:33-1928(-)
MSSRARSRSRSRSRERRHKHDRRHRDDRDKERDSRDSRSDRDRRDYRDKDRESRDKGDSHRDKKEKYENKSSSGERGNNDSSHRGDNIKNNGAPVPSSADKSEPPAPLLPSGLSITKNAAQLASILAKTKQQLEEQKKKLLEKVKETEQTTDARPASVKQESRSAAPSLVTIEPAPVKEEIDVFAIPVRVPTTLKANQKMQQAEEQRLEQKARTLDKLLKTPGKTVPLPEGRIDEQYFDHRLGKDPTYRRKRTFNFVEPGTYVDQANRERETKRQRVESGEGETGAASVKPEEPVSTSDSRVTPSDTVPRDKKSAEQIPDVEWWDLPFLEVTREDSEGRKVSLPPSYELQVLEDKINKLIEHPTVIAPPAEAPAPPPQQLKLTAAERKKLRRQERARTRELEREKYLLGLTEAPKPKVKISNMMRVYGSEAVQDPTQLEALVKKEMAERHDRHEQRNEERKLTPEERREKKRAKMLEDTKLLSHVAVFKIPPPALSDPKIRFKIDMNASQNYLSGTGVITPSMAIIVIEGGPNAIKRYKKLMLRRIPWKSVAGDKTDEAEEDEDEDQDREQANSRYCQLVWEGEVLKPTFRSFKVEQFAEEGAARKFLSENGIPHYWDQAKALPSATELFL